MAAGFVTAAEAEAAFYKAFASANLTAMMAVWAPSGEVECIHPMSPRLSSLPAIRESWRQIFQDARLVFTLTEVQRFSDTQLAVHVLHERIQPALGGTPQLMIATNMYRRIGDSWHMVLHHASPIRGEPTPNTVH